ncbi:LysR family transcriptional regulator [Neorhizobium sp. AL 9.2.2]|jgi:DNA-binding transcriptional LysR family regulator|uniref:LysR family transcriptional regulator n=1 Tax=Neorhizobium sp. AL 9.2.2 TaxID=2712894 RepID=UPI000DDD7CD3|nr:LysR family transcriptional regulator [Neorhizobium sp. AL 9.2.2]NSY19663.1 LysR family transcriptional regulator [Neorhizobium sp. AL 9.2.2]
MTEIEQKPDISLRLLEIFGAMMRCETTVEAAEQLGISQPAVSNGIRQLENQLGITLFERLHRRLEPTEEATLLFEEVRPVFSMLRSFSARARSIRHGTSGRLRVMSTPPLGNTVAPVALARFLKDRPDVSVAYDVRRLEHVIEAVQSGAADVGLAIALERHPSVNVEILSRTHMVALVPKDHPVASRQEVTVSDLSEHGFIGLEAESRMGQMLRDAFDREGIDYEPRVEVRYCATAAVLAGAGVGAAVVDPYSAAYQSSEGLVQLPFQPPREVAAVLITRKGIPRSRLLHGFIAELKRAAGDVF